MPAYVPPHLRNASKNNNGPASPPKSGGSQNDKPAPKPASTPNSGGSQNDRPAPKPTGVAQDTRPAPKLRDFGQDTRPAPRPRDLGRDTSWGGNQRQESRGFERNDRNDRNRTPQKNSRFSGMFDGVDFSSNNSGGRGGRSYGNKRGGRGFDGRLARMELDLVPNPILENDLFGEENKSMEMGINFASYNEIEVEVSGQESPVGFETFEECDFHPSLLANVTRCGYSVPTPVQKYSVPIVTKRRDLMACAQTGSGKTAAFLLPTIQNLLIYEPLNKKQEKRGSSYSSRSKYYPRGLILAPTRELVQQIHVQARKFLYCTGMRAVCIYGGSPIVDQFKNLDVGVHLLVATPGRLWDMIERSRMSLSQCEYLVLDEADRMLDMGFEPQIRNIVEDSDMVKKTEGRVTLMYSATFPEEIQQLAQDFLDNYIFLAVGRVGATTESISQHFLQVQDRDKMDQLQEILPECEGLKLCFTATKRCADEVEYILNEQGFSATCIHGDKDQYERERALKLFRTGKVETLVATDVAARGLDIPNVKWVIQYDLPSTIDDYVHRIGRTGRCGHTGTAVSFVNENNGNITSDLIDILKEANQEVPQWLGGLSRYGRKKGKGGRNKGRYGGRDFRNNHKSNNRRGGGNNNRRNNDRGGW